MNLREPPWRRTGGWRQHPGRRVESQARRAGSATPICFPASVSTSPRRSTISSSRAASQISGGAICITASPRSSVRAIRPASRKRLGRKPRISWSRSSCVEAGVVGVGDHLDRPEEAGAADVADDRQRPQLVHPRLAGAAPASRTFSSTPSRSKISMFLQRDRGAQRVAGEGDAVPEHPARALDQRLGHPGPGEHGAHRRVRRGEALGHADQVGGDALARAGEELADPTEAGDHLVGHQQDAVPVGDLPQAGPVARRRRDRAAGVLHRLGDDQRDLVRSRRRGPPARPRPAAARRRRPGRRRRAARNGLVLRRG